MEKGKMEKKIHLVFSHPLKTHPTPTPYLYLLFLKMVLNQILDSLETYSKGKLVMRLMF
jgi:hypothetical protein